MKQQRSKRARADRRPGEDGWSWMLRWLFSQPGRLVRSGQREDRIYLAPF